jgi:glyoxylase I family protein
MFKGFEHAAIAARNSRSLADWYISLFDLKTVYDDKKEEPTYLLQAPDGSVIEILPATAGQPADYDQQLLGLRHLALTVDDYDGAVKWLRDKGVTEFFDERGADNFRLVFFRDPEGNLLHLMWRSKPLG